MAPTLTKSTNWLPLQIHTHSSFLYLWLWKISLFLESSCYQTANISWGRQMQMWYYCSEVCLWPQHSQHCKLMVGSVWTCITEIQLKDLLGWLLCGVPHACSVPALNIVLFLSVFALKCWKKPQKSFFFCKEKMWRKHCSKMFLVKFVGFGSLFPNHGACILNKNHIIYTFLWNVLQFTLSLTQNIFLFLTALLMS